jgi:hypothetical protein
MPTRTPVQKPGLCAESRASANAATRFLAILNRCSSPSLAGTMLLTVVDPIVTLHAFAVPDISAPMTLSLPMDPVAKLLSAYETGQTVFRGAVLKHMSLAGAYLPFIDFLNANLSHADLTGTCLIGACLIRAHLQHACLNNANLIGSDLIWANLHGAMLENSLLASANLNGADLSGADLTNATLNGAGLCGANLKGANLRGANLKGADLKAANLLNANLDGAILDAVVLKFTVMPDGQLWSNESSSFEDASTALSTISFASRLHKQFRAYSSDE